LFPDAWEKYLGAIPESERGDLVQAYHKRLIGKDDAVMRAAAKAWSVWEGSTSQLRPEQSFVEHYGDDHFSVAFARIECHYFVNGGWMREKPLLSQIHRIRNIPGVIVQGRYDVVCPAKSAWDLHRAWPEADLQIIPDAGHSAFEPGNLKALVAATDRFAN
jgi:proline iminopeptidase